MNRPRIAAIALACLPCLSGLFPLLAWGAEPVTARPALTVSTTRPSQTQLPLQLNANGNVAAWQEALVSLEAQGLRLTQVLVNVGDTVRAGQVLARLADETVQADLAQARAALLEAEANADEAVANASRTRQVQAGGALSEQQISQALSAERAAQARVLAARASVQSQELRLRQTQVLAPDSGVISARSATVGAVPASGTELFRLIRQNRLEWRAEVTAAELPRLPRAVDDLVMRALSIDPSRRFQTVDELAEAILHLTGYVGGTTGIFTMINYGLREKVARSSCSTSAMRSATKAGLRCQTPSASPGT
mgnify:CR=1 FL=1